MNERLKILLSDNYKEIRALLLAPFESALQKTMQNPVWHGEGDVLRHTEMVCETLLGLPEYESLAPRQKSELLCAALLHDIGKIPCTKLENGEWTSPHHGSVGACMARAYLWKELGLCGDADLQNFRETVCLLIRYHMTPVHLSEYNDAEVRLRRIAANGLLAPDFSLKLLCLLAQADVLGRISGSLAESAEKVQFCAELAKESGCFESPYPFPTDYTRYSYLDGKNIAPDQPFYDDTWGEVILLAGLPGTGKDSYIAKHYPDLPVVSLDRIRKEHHISPVGSQSEVVSIAREQAKDYLRRHQPFVWNATSISRQIRQKQIGLFHSYGASVRIVFLETGWNEELRRNQNRAAKVPVSVIERMLGDLTLPEGFEAESVEWNCI